MKEESGNKKWLKCVVVVDRRSPRRQLFKFNGGRKIDFKEYWEFVNREVFKFHS